MPEGCDSKCMTLEHSYFSNFTVVPFATNSHLFGKSQETNEYRIFIRQTPRIDPLRLKLTEYTILCQSTTSYEGTSFPTTPRAQ